MTRKIIQLAGFLGAGEEEGYPVELILACCDDGTAWCTVPGPGKAWSHWAPLPPIPQPEVPPAPADTTNQPLWQAMERAGQQEPGAPLHAIAAQIEAMRDWMFPGRHRFANEYRQVLTEQAQLAREDA